MRASTAPIDPDDVPEVVHSLLAPAPRHRVPPRGARHLRRGRLPHRPDRRPAARRVHRCRHRDRGDAPRPTASRWFPLAVRQRDGHGIGVPYDIAAHPFLAHAVLRGPGHARLARRPRGQPRGRPGPGRAGAELVSRRRPTGASRVDAARRGRAGRRGVGARPGAGADGVRRCLRPTRRWRVCCARSRSGEIRDAAWCPLTRSNAQEHVSFWTDVCRRTPAELLAPPATLLGWAAWQAGHGALAWCAADLAATCDPDYTLTRYLAHALEHAIAPSVWESGWDWKEGLTQDDPVAAGYQPSWFARSASRRSSS